VTESNASKSGRESTIAYARETGATIRQLAAKAGSYAGLSLTGTASDIADEMEIWLEQRGSDKVMFPYVPDGLLDFTTKVVPEFPTAYKLKAIKRFEQGEGVLPVARELGISRKILHDRIKAWKVQGPERPKPGPRKLKAPAAYDDKRSAVARANARIAELERLVGRQQMDLDFFRQALRALERPVAQGKSMPRMTERSR
jgi:transposase